VVTSLLRRATAVAVIALALFMTVRFSAAQRGRPAERPLRVLCVFAHPDDETFYSGTLALMARKGAEIHTLYLSSGEKGKDASGRQLVAESLAAEREDEVRTALQTLAIEENPVFARLPDSPQFPDVETESAAAKLYFDVISERLKQIEPVIVITFGPDGETGHFQHRMVGMATTLAFDTTGIGDVLLYGVSSKPRRAPITKVMPTYGHGPYSVAPRRISLTVDIRDALDLKMRSMADHKTQFDPWSLRTLGKLHTQMPFEEFITARSVRRIKSLDDLLDVPR
jgi:N-acetylglucosamine malate deacetylase 2